MKESQIRWLILLGFGAAALYYFLARHKSATALALPSNIEPVAITPKVTSPFGQPIKVTPSVLDTAIKSVVITPRVMP